MAGILGRLLIIDDQRDFARLLGAIAERLGYTTRILQHMLDLKYVMQHRYAPYLLRSASW
jgi:hypothetical protein